MRTVGAGARKCPARRNPGKFTSPGRARKTPSPDRTRCRPWRQYTAPPQARHQRAFRPCGRTSPTSCVLLSVRSPLSCPAAGKTPRRLLSVRTRIVLGKLQYGGAAALRRPQPQRLARTSSRNRTHQAERQSTIATMKVFRLHYSMSWAPPSLTRRRCSYSLKLSQAPTCTRLREDHLFVRGARHGAASVPPWIPISAEAASRSAVPVWAYVRSNTRPTAIALQPVAAQTGTPAVTTEAPITSMHAIPPHSAVSAGASVFPVRAASTEAVRAPMRHPYSMVAARPRLRRTAELTVAPACQAVRTSHRRHMANKTSRSRDDARSDRCPTHVSESRKAERFAKSAINSNFEL